ncbi:MAG TPA: N-formylglutamate amidohydrolase [Polyangia bacterium]
MSPPPNDVSKAFADAFAADLPDPPPSPLVVSVPHAGTGTAGFESALASTLDVRCDADLFVDELYEVAAPAVFVRSRLSRFVCDLNRHPDDVSARAVPSHPAPRNQDGRGFLWEVTTTGAKALARPLSQSEWETRRDFHAAYHGALTDALTRARAKFGFAILLDGHSMPSVGRQGHTDTGRARADIVPGDRKGTSCGPALAQLVRAHFVGAGLRVAFNDPYQGGYITTAHGQPASGIHAIQIEMRRDLYMNEASFERRPAEMATLSAILAELVRKLETFDPR